MKNLNFCKKIEETYYMIEKKLEKYSTKIDIDYYIQNNVMKITFPNSKKIILNSQESLKELWMATETQGYHFKYIKNDWYCKKNKKKLNKILEKEFLNQLSKKINFS